jgi:diaminopimelate epimerase
MAAGFRIRVIDRKCRVTLPGGDLFMECREADGHILMTGPVSYDFEGTLPAHLSL